MTESANRSPAHAGSITGPEAMFTEPEDLVTTGVSLSNGRYSIGEQLGSGGSANVYRARDELLSRPVAVKLFRDEAATANDRLRQEREIRLLGELRHPGLVELYDSGSVLHRGVEHRYLVMEYIPGATLTDRLQDGPMLPRDAAALGAQVADALSFIHTRSIVHRDVKPDNILFSDIAAFGHANLVKLSDFGIAHFVGGSRLTNTEAISGTASYLSPEQALGETVGTETDIYSLGLVLLEAITGRREFDGGIVESAVARLHRDPVIPPELPAAWHPLLRSMTARKAENRPAAHEVASSLREIWADSRVRRVRRVRARLGVVAAEGVAPRIALLLAAATAAAGLAIGLAVGILAF
ncbi:serine/threonine protein kinase [Plantibacter flavus]|uniref:serine/threonine-protein kinase n=1 Tax=Plantibacter flavus TaxID=150123 RepID=UPI003F13FC58